MFCITAKEGSQLLNDRVIAAYSKNNAQKYHSTIDDICLFYYFCKSYSLTIYFFSYLLKGQTKKQQIPTIITHKPQIIKLYKPKILTNIGPIIAPVPQIPYEKLTTYLVFPFEAYTKQTFTNTYIDPSEMFMTNEMSPNKKGSLQEVQNKINPIPVKRQLKMSLLW